MSLVGLLTGPPGTVNPREVFGYFHRDSLEAVRVGRWKLHLWRDGEEQSALYDVSTDLGETQDAAAEHADAVAHLHEVADRLRVELGDARLGIVGTGVRPIGRVTDPKPLTQYDPSHPYLIAEYDISDRG